MTLRYHSSVLMLHSKLVLWGCNSDHTCELYSLRSTPYKIAKGGWHTPGHSPQRCGLKFRVLDLALQMFIQDEPGPNASSPLRKLTVHVIL